MFSLFDAFDIKKSKDDFDLFLKDLCTPSEIKELEERFLIAQILYTTNKSYRTIHKEFSVSPSTVTRVARFLKKESHQGYKTVLDRLYK